MKKSVNRFISIFMIFLMFATLYISVPIAAVTTLNVFEYDNYKIIYSIVNEWDNYHNIEIKITNTGNETIYNWALGYDAGGDISNVWNGTIYNSKGTNYIIKNAGYNYEILPGNSVTFGYTLQGEKLAIPNSFELCSKRIEINEGYNAQLVIEDKWETGFSGYIEILNESDIPFEAWMLSFDTNFVISDLWNAIIVENEDYTYTVSSQIMSNPISSGSSMKIGITASFEEGVEPVITKELISIVQIDDSALNNVKENIIDNSDEIVGKMYFKDLTSEDDIICDSDGNRYFKNQILVTACDGVSFDTINDLVHSMDAEIVGYIELTNDYQIEFNYNISLKEINNIINELKNNAIIEFISLNIINDIIYDSIPNDTKIQPAGVNKDIDIHNDNWHIYAIRADEAWKYFMDAEYTPHSVNIGIIDSCFSSQNNDLNFCKLWNNEYFPQDDHGTLVAGIIGAQFNNGKGVAGICPTSKLFGYSFNNVQNVNIASMTPLMRIKYVLALMIGNNNKVINISLSLKDDNNIDFESKSVENTLNKLLNKGYDFLIVNSAGNKSTDASTNSYFSYINENSSVGKRIIVVGAVVHQSENNGTTNGPVSKTDVDGNLTLECIYRSNSNYGSRVNIVAPGAGILSTGLGAEEYDTFDHTSSAAPQVAGVAGMLYSINPNLKGSQVKEMIISSAKESANTNPNRKISYNGLDYYLLDAKAAVDMAMSLNGPFLPSIENNEAIVYGVVTDVNDEPIKNTKIKLTTKSSSSKDTLYFETDENGEYLITLKIDTYNLKFSINDESFLGWHYNKDYAYHTIKNKEITVDKEGYNNAYPLDVKLDNTTTESVGIYNDSNGVSISDVIATIKAENGSSQTVTLNSSELSYNDVEDGIYTISLNKDGYIPATIQVNAMGGNIYDQNGEILEKITLTPIEASIYGTVTVKNLTTNKITPKAGHTVTLLKDGSNFTSVSTQDDGTYRINLKEYGNYTIVFSEDYQYEVPITSNLNCEINCVFEVEEDEDEDEEDEDENDEGDDGNSDEDDNGNTDDGNFGEGDGINIDFTGDGDSSFTGDESGNLSDGVWLKIFDGADSYYARIYTTSDSGEYKSTFGSPGWGLHTTMYNYWTGQLKMATYRCDGTLIKDQVIEYFYKKTHIYLPNSNSTDTTPLMRIDAITSLSIDSTGVTYTIHTDGYYKETFNIVGSLGVKKEDWTDDKTITISLYKGSSPTGASTASPFEN